MNPFAAQLIKLCLHCLHCLHWLGSLEHATLSQHCAKTGLNKITNLTLYLTAKTNFVWRNKDFATLVMTLNVQFFWIILIVIGGRYDTDQDDLQVATAIINVEMYYLACHWWQWCQWCCSLFDALINKQCGMQWKYDNKLGNEWLVS